MGSPTAPLDPTLRVTILKAYTSHQQETIFWKSNYTITFDLRVTVKGEIQGHSDF